METRRWSRTLLKAERAREHQHLIELQGERDGLDSLLEIATKEYNTLYQDILKSKNVVPDYVIWMLGYWKSRKDAISKDLESARFKAASALGIVEDLTTAIEELDKAIKEEDKEEAGGDNGD